MMEITTKSSMSVKPFLWVLEGVFMRVAFPMVNVVDGLVGNNFLTTVIHSTPRGGNRKSFPQGVEKIIRSAGTPTQTAPVFAGPGWHSVDWRGPGGDSPGFPPNPPEQLTPTRWSKSAGHGAFSPEIPLH
jgi:hypothetical protein